MPPNDKKPVRNAVKPPRGCSDKKNCSDTCRVSCNNKLRNVNNGLAQKNAASCQNSTPDEKTKVSREKMCEEGGLFSRVYNKFSRGHSTWRR